MNDTPQSVPTAARVRQPRLAELVASSLRDDILSGRLREGDFLPPLEELLADYPVSPPVGREAVRILETEGLITVRRGNQGGAVVRLPGPGRVGYMASLILETEQTPLADVGVALRELEPRCAALCADVQRRDGEVLPALRAAIVLSWDSEDGEARDAAAEQFHDELVERCGNEALILAFRALESIWSGHRGATREAGSDSLETHEGVAELVASGDMLAVFNAEHAHLTASGRFDPPAGAEPLVRSDRVSDGVG